MRVFIVTREENGHTSVWPPFAKQETAENMIRAHVKRRVEVEGAFACGMTRFTPPTLKAGRKVRLGGSETNPIMGTAPECHSCVVAEIVVFASREDAKGKRTVFRVTQHPIIDA